MRTAHARGSQLLLLLLRLLGFCPPANHKIGNAPRTFVQMLAEDAIRGRANLAGRPAAWREIASAVNLANDRSLSR
jgi:hypothetical protein